MATLTTAHVLTLLTPPAPPCVSLYLPTHRSEPGRREDPIRFKNLVRRADESLRQKYPGNKVQEVVRKLDALTGDAAFWSTQQDGLGVLAGGTVFEAYRLPRPVKELAVVADSFHVKPLLRVTQGVGRYQVLALSRTQCRLFEGDRYALDEVRADGFPPDYETAVGEELTEPMRTRITSGARSPATGHYSVSGAGKDGLDRDTEKFFRVVDREVAERFSTPSGLPLVLACLPQHATEFRQRSRNPHLLPDGVEGDAPDMTADQLRTVAWAVMEKRVRDRIAELKEVYGTASARKMASADPSDVAPAALDGRVGTLLVDADKVVPGRFDPQTRSVTLGRMEDPGTDDLLDDLSELTLKTGGRVVVLPSAEMPTDTGLAAVYRF